MHKQEKIFRGVAVFLTFPQHLWLEMLRLFFSSCDEILGAMQTVVLKVGLTEGTINALEFGRISGGGMRSHATMCSVAILPTTS